MSEIRNLLLNLRVIFGSTFASLNSINMRISLIILSVFITAIPSAQTIQEIQGTGAATPFADTVVMTSGIVTAIGSEGYFIQNGTGERSGIYVYDQSNVPDIGDMLELTADVVEFFDLTELTNVSSFSIVSSGNELPAAQVIPTGDASEDWESVLVKVEEATCTDPDIGFGEFQLDDGSGSIAVDDFMYLFTASEDIQYTVTGPLYYSFGAFKIVPRDEADIEIAEPLYFTSNPEEFDLTTTSMNIEWTTNAPGNTLVAYGTTPAYELGIISTSDLVTNHSIALENLSPATVYYVAANSDDGINMTPIHEWVVSTVSESSGQIDVIFNHSVDTDFATITPATVNSDIAMEFVDAIESANETLDIAMYDWLEIDESIINAINAAHLNGVQVRIVTDIELENVELELLDSSIPVIKGTEQGIMHDKFLVIDVDSEDAFVVTGSTNWTDGNLGWDFNNVMILHDQSIAKAYTLEFNEMYGSSGAQPNQEQARFGADKTDNTPHKFLLDGIEVELYFSPSDNATGQMIERIAEAQNRIDFGVMVFTENSLGNAIIDAYDNGIAMTGIIDYVEFTGSEFEMLQSSGIEVFDYINEDGSQWPDGPVFHHKYCIIDHESSDVNPVLINGSHNWSASAESINDENTLIIYDHDIANQFYQEYVQRRAEQIALDIEQLDKEGLLVYPNPTSGQLRIDGTNDEIIEISDVAGRLVFTKQASFGSTELDLNSLVQGLYVLRVGDSGTTRIIIE